MSRQARTSQGYTPHLVGSGVQGRLVLVSRLPAQVGAVGAPPGGDRGGADDAGGGLLVAGPRQVALCWLESPDPTGATGLDVEDKLRKIRVDLHHFF